MIVSIQAEQDYTAWLQDIVRLFWTPIRIERNLETADIIIQIRDAAAGARPALEMSVSAPEGHDVSIAEISDSGHAYRLIRRMLFGLLTGITGRNPNPYGILTGVRPVKVVHKMLDTGYDAGEIEEALNEQYLIQPDRAGLLTEVAANNRAYLHSSVEAGQWVSVYIGIPYCPSRCLYCSFPGYSLTYQPGLDDFIRGLLAQAETIGQAVRDKNMRVENIYIGGGTPSVLNEAHWQTLLQMLHKYYICSETKEFTVELGRPDTIHAQMLTWLKEGGANRLCINPQTMSNETLRLIGRSHTAEQTLEAFRCGREAGFDHINMDIIIGLPGEGMDRIRHSLDDILDLGPEGITIHSLARKRGSRWAAQDFEGDVRDNEFRDAQMVCRNIMAANGYFPYYMYRQKRAVSGGENVGYAKPGYFCNYNIQMIEERQTILGMGGGAASKFVNPDNWSLTSILEPADPGAYLKSRETIAIRQVDNLYALT